VHRKFSSTIHNIHLYTTNTLYPILYPPPPTEKYSKQNEKTKQDNKNKNKRQMTFGCIYVSQWIYIYIQQILYIQSSNHPTPEPHSKIIIMLKKTYISWVHRDWKTVIYIYACGKCRTQFMLPMEKSVTFTGACANAIIPEG
jgi:hypothetical protein